MTDNGFCLCDNTLRSDLVSFEYEMLVVPAAGELQCRVGWDGESALWFRLTKNQDISAGPLARPFARTAHSFACSALLASLAHSAALTRSLARSLRSLPSLWDSE